MDDATARIVGGIYIALCSALSEEGAKHAHELLRGWAESPNIRPEDRRIYGCIVRAASMPAEELEQFEADRPNLRVVLGGAA